MADLITSIPLPYVCLGISLLLSRASTTVNSYPGLTRAIAAARSVAIVSGQLSLPVRLKII